MGGEYFANKVSGDMLALGVDEGRASTFPRLNCAVTWLGLTPSANLRALESDQ